MEGTRAKHKLEHEYGGQKKKETWKDLVGWGGRCSQVANTEHMSTHASEDEDDKYQVLTTDHEHSNTKSSTQARDHKHQLEEDEHVTKRG